MRQAITTKYLGPTNSRGSRIKATARKRSNSGPEMSATTSYQHGGTEIEHCRAAKACAEKLGWSGLWVGGGNVDEDGFVFVCVGGITKAHVADALAGRMELGTEGRDWFLVNAKEG